MVMYTNYKCITYLNAGTQNSGGKEPKILKVRAQGFKHYEVDKKKYSFERPYLLAKGPYGEIIVGNNAKGAHHLVVFDEKLQFLKIIGSEGEGDGKFWFIRGIAVDEIGHLYVTDSKQHCVQKFTLDNGEFDSQFGKPGTGNGEFNVPAGLLISKSNFLFVCDRMNDRIQVFNGKDYLYKIEETDDHDKTHYFKEPVDLAFNNSETVLFVTYWRNHIIQAFTPLGVRLKIVDFPSGFRLQHPNGIYFTSDGRLLVSAVDHVYILKDNTWTAVKPILVPAIDSQPPSNAFGDYIGVLMMNNGKILITDGVNGYDQLFIVPTK